MDLDYERFVERFKRPSHKGRLENSFMSEVSNVSCGDRIIIYLRIDKEGVVSDAKFDGEGCALSITTADLLCDYVIGKKIEEVCKLDFNKVTEVIGFVPSINRAGCVGIVVDALGSICRKYGMTKRG